jgi:hypothetical protein
LHYPKLPDPLNSRPSHASRNEAIRILQAGPTGRAFSMEWRGPRISLHHLSLSRLHTRILYIETWLIPLFKMSTATRSASNPSPAKKRKMAPAVTNGHSSPATATPVPAKPNQTSDPLVYDIHHQKFNSDGLPKTTDAWIDRARQVAQILAADAPVRDIENKTPKAEVALLKSAGLLKALGPTKYGGGGQTWDVGYKLIREVAKGDGSLGMLLGYHLLWSTTANVVGTDEQKERTQKLIIENNYFIGGL